MRHSYPDSESGSEFEIFGNAGSGSVRYPYNKYGSVTPVPTDIRYLYVGSEMFCLENSKDTVRNRWYLKLILRNDSVTTYNSVISLHISWQNLPYVIKKWFWKRILMWN